VLSSFTKKQQPLIDIAIKEAADAALYYACHDIDAAMNKYN